MDRFCVQGEETARRLTALGADPARVIVTGSLKFDALDNVPIPGRGPGARAALLPRSRRTGRCSWPGSTLRGEEECGDPRVQSHARVVGGSHPLLILAARHPERFAEVERLCTQEGLATVRRSSLPIDAEPRADAVVLDTIGELAQVYQVATAVFVGGSLVPAGGHNILEPALYGKPIIFGPHMENFARDRRHVPGQRRGHSGGLRAGARRRGDEPDGRSGSAREARRRGQGPRRGEPRGQGPDAARGDRPAAGAQPEADGRGPSVPRRPLSPFSLGSVYGGVARVRRSWYERHPEARRRLDRPVVSVGNSRVGGSGQDAGGGRAGAPAGVHGPPAGGAEPRLRTAREERRRGRGERRRARAALASKSPATSRRCWRGRFPACPCWSSADRHLAGRLAERRFGATVHLLDDGFQHLRAGARRRAAAALGVGPHEPVLPVGRLREPLHAARVRRRRAGARVERRGRAGRRRLPA